MAPQRPTERSQVWDAVFLLAPFLVLVVLTFCSTADDPLITLRYAHNILGGHGPVFNIGERVEGFTSPLHLFLMLGIAALPRWSHLLGAKLLSLVFGLLTLREACRLLRCVDLPAWAVRAGLVLVGASVMLARASSNGLETTLEAWLTALLVVRLLRGDAFRRPWSTGLVAAGSVLARPEAVGIVLGLWLTAMFATRAVPIARRVAWAWGAAAAVVVSEAFRLAYYRSWLPNTYFAKQLPLWTAVNNGLRYLAIALQPFALRGPHSAHAILSIALLFVELLFILVGVIEILRKRRDLLFIAVPVALQALFIIRAGGDWMLGGRFVAPVAPELIVAELVGLVRVVRDQHDVAGAALGGTALAVAAALLPLWGQVDPLWASSGRFDTAALVAAGDYGALTKVWSDAPRLFACAPGGGLVAFSEVGFLGEERPDLRLVDLRGLTDRQIARESSVHTKAIPGVSDTGWFEPGSAVGGVLQDRRPVMIASFDGSPPPVLWGGEYRRVGVRQYVDRRRPHPLTVSVYRRSGDRCGSVERAFARVGAVGR